MANCKQKQKQLPAGNFTPCSSVSIVNFEQVNAGWVTRSCHLRLLGNCIKIIAENRLKSFTRTKSF